MLKATVPNYTNFMQIYSHVHTIFKLKLEQALKDKEDELATRSRTSKLWLSYSSMVQTSRMLIMADRTGSWQTHIAAVTECLPIFAAAGHFNPLLHDLFYNLPSKYVSHIWDGMQ